MSILTAIEQGIGSIYILVNNAGIDPVRSLEDLSEEDFDRTIAVNLKVIRDGGWSQSQRPLPLNCI